MMAAELSVHILYLWYKHMLADELSMYILYRDINKLTYLCIVYLWFKQMLAAELSMVEHMLAADVYLIREL